MALSDNKNINYKIAIITPLNGDWTYDSYTIIDGLIQLQNKNRKIQLLISTNADTSHPFSVEKYVLSQSKFIDFAKNADLILLFWSKGNTDLKLAEKIKRWDKTAYVDGSELGNNNRYDFAIQRDVLSRKYKGEFGGIDEEMIRKCALYFRREKPYPEGIIPLPYGITSVYRKYYEPNKKKDIDFFCVWGQDEYPSMRRYAQDILIDFCKKHGFTYWVDKTKNRDEFYEKLSRSKVGISIGGGGYDTARFWEILANNCILLTEKIDIFQPDSEELNYKRIFQFNNLYDFQYQLEKLGRFLRQKYDNANLLDEFRDILSRHSSEARAIKIIKKAKSKFKTDEENKKLCSIVVSSFDGYSDLWEPFFKLFFKYWPDWPFPIYLISNYKKYNDSNVTTLQLGEDKGWSVNIKNALKKIPTSYFILMHDEFFVEKPVNNRRIIKLLNLIEANKDIGCIRLNPTPGPDEDWKNNLLDLGKISKDAPYRFSLQASIWDKNTFMKVLGDHAKIYDVEEDGSTRSRNMNRLFLSVKKPVIDYDPRSAIVRGKWNYNTVKLCKREGVVIGINKRVIDYDRNWKTFFDKLRKSNMALKIKNIPLVAEVNSFFYKKIIKLKINNLPLVSKIHKIFLRQFLILI